MLKQDLIRTITRGLSFLSSEVEQCGKLNLTDIHVHAEDFYKELLNLILGYKFKNINIDVANVPAIDLGDDVNKIAIQITSTSSVGKIKNTVKKYKTNKLDLIYDRLIVLRIGRETKHSVKTVEHDGFSIDIKEDVWGISTLLNLIKEKSDEELLEISKYIEHNLFYPNKASIPNEFRTLVELIEILSDDNHSMVGKGFVEEPDPGGKIYKRFAEHSEFLTSEYINHYKDYGAILKGIEEGHDIGSVRINRIERYLKSYSDRVLTEHKDDPVAALHSLQDEFTSLICGRGINADVGAVRFYLVAQLTRCNVFPIKDKI